MLRWLYIQLIWLHPAPFRWRFGDDMLDDFDRAPLRNKPRYFADAAASLARQWLLRPEFRQPDTVAATAEAALRAAGVPLFQTIEDYKPRPAVFFQGGLLSILWILAAVVLIVKGGGVAKPFVIGVHFSRPGILPFARNSVVPGDLNTSVAVAPDPIEEWLTLARPYFAAMPVLRALDTDRNLTLSPGEIGNAPAVLRRLDTDHDGRLVPEEIGMHMNPDFLRASILPGIRRRFMNYHPVLAALDANDDGEISASEIASASSALRKLDSNHDGYLTPDEVIPPQMAAHAQPR